MTEQEWLEGMADQWMRGPVTAPAFRPDLPHVSDCGWRIVLAPVSRPMLERIEYADEVEFYAVFDGREVTTRRPRSAMTQSA